MGLSSSEWNVKLLSMHLSTLLDGSLRNKGDRPSLWAPSPLPTYTVLVRTVECCMAWIMEGWRTDSNLTCNLTTLLYKTNPAPLQEKLHHREGKQTIIQLLVRRKKRQKRWAERRTRAYQRLRFWEENSLNPEEGRVLCRPSSAFWQPHLTGAGAGTWAPSSCENRTWRAENEL